MPHPDGSYDPVLVVLSYGVATLASFTALSFAWRVAHSDGRAALRWLIGGGTGMGAGIWSMHFIGMLAYHAGMAVQYDPVLTSASVLVAVVCSTLALRIGTRPGLSLTGIAKSGVVLGGGISGMHYLGMASMEMDAVIQYDPALVGASVVVGITAASAALWIFSHLSALPAPRVNLTLGAALVMGLAVCGMHYTGMAAATMVPLSTHAPATAGSAGWLAFGVGIGTVLILCTALIALLLDYRFAMYRQTEARLETLVQARTAELARKEELLRTVMDSLPDPIVVSDAAGRPLLHNLASARERGFETVDAALSASGSGDAQDDLFTEVVQTARPILNHEREDRLNGEARWVLDTRVPLLGDGGVSGVVQVCRDVTAQKQAKAALVAAKEAAEASTRSKSEFLANMSHEIRTPMNGVIGMTSLLLDTDLDTEQKDFVETIRTSGDALLTIINDILDFSKIEAGKIDMEIAPFDVRDCTESALDLVAQTAANKGVELAYVIEEGVPGRVVGDVTRVRQVLVNLLSNAVKFTAEGSVCVRVDADPVDVEAGGQTMLRFAVEDTGVGIPDDKLEFVFESFSQADASTTRRFGGTGLGLTISRRLVDMMGGEMSVESEEGVGSTFRFSVSAEVAASERRVFLRPDHPALKGRRVLIVDDNRVNREILTRLAERWGMPADTHTSGADAVRAATVALREGRPYDAVLLDMQMPGMDGLAVARALQDLLQEAPPVTVMLTSINWDASHREAARAAGIHEVLYKPTKPALLYDALVHSFSESSPGPAPSAQTVVPDAAPAPEAESGLRVLLAEDNLVNQKVAVRTLERLGYRADVVADGLEVLDALRQHSYDVILMDVQMPNLDGLETTARIRSEWPADDQPHIVALTANAMEGDRDRCLSAGCDAYLPKPLDRKALADVLEAIVPPDTMAMAA